MGKVSIKLVGELARRAGSGDIEVEIGSSATLKEVVGRIAGAYPELAKFLMDGTNASLRPYILLAINGRQADLTLKPDYTLQGGEQLTLIVTAFEGG